jgi:hypothetical protein
MPRQLKNQNLNMTKRNKRKPNFIKNSIQFLYFSIMSSIGNESGFKLVFFSCSFALLVSEMKTKRDVKTVQNM